MRGVVRQLRPLARRGRGLDPAGRQPALQGGRQPRARRDGFIKNIGAGNEGGSIKRNYFEIQAEAELGDKTTAWVRYSRTSWDDTTGVGDRWSNLVTPYDTTRAFQPIGGCVTNPQFGYTTANPGVTDPYTQNTNRNGYGQLRGNHLITAQVTYDLGFADLKYIGGFQQYNYQTGGDYDATSRTGPITVGPAPCPVFVDYTTDFNEHKSYYSNEINLTSKGDGPLRWIARPLPVPGEVPAADPAGRSAAGPARRSRSTSPAHPAMRARRRPTQPQLRRPAGAA